MAGAALESWGRAAVPTRNNLPTWAGAHHTESHFFSLSVLYD